MSRKQHNVDNVYIDWRSDMTGTAIIDAQHTPFAAMNDECKAQVMERFNALVNLCEELNVPCMAYVCLHSKPAKNMFPLLTEVYRCTGDQHVIPDIVLKRMLLMQIFDAFCCGGAQARRIMETALNIGIRSVFELHLENLREMVFGTRPPWDNSAVIKNFLAMTDREKMLYLLDYFKERVDIRDNPGGDHADKKTV